jgi:hypothetical protein
MLEHKPSPTGHEHADANGRSAQYVIGQSVQ